MPVQVAKGSYAKGKYAPLERYIAYHYQVEGVRKLQPTSILFIGVGDGLVPFLLKQQGRYEVTTLDIDEHLKPDVLSDMRSMPFPDASFDLVCVFEVLEHLPFDESRKAIAEIARVARQGAFISLPNRQAGIDVGLKVPFIRTLFKTNILSFSLLFPIKFPGFAVSKQHYWEIDFWTTTRERVRKALREHFDITAEYTPVLNHYHRFFELKKRS